MGYGGQPHLFSIGPITTLTGKSKHRKNGLEKIQYFVSRLHGELIIIDPYFYKPAYKQKVDDYIKEIKNVLLLFQNVKRVHIIYDDEKTHPMVRNEFKKLQNKYNCKLTDTHTTLIHDRVWMGDRRTARLLGSSFNGIGRSKISFMLPLPSQDLTDLQFFLQENELIPDDMQLINNIDER